MIDPSKIFGRLGNSMFQYAALYAFAKDYGVDYYFQDPKWFENYQDEIRTLFGGDIPPATEAVAIHVRRGDYVGNPFYVDLSQTDYYKQAMALFPNEKFIVFSDDPLWCEEHFKECEISYLSHIEEMNKIASCKGQIIANSSFSWWAAWLSPYSKKIVAPSVKNWYTDGVERTVCPDNWIRL